MKSVRARLKIMHCVYAIFIMCILLVAGCREELFDPAKNAFDSRNGQENGTNTPPGGNSLPYNIVALVLEEGSTKVLASDGNRIFGFWHLYDGDPTGKIYIDINGWIFVSRCVESNNYVVYSLKDGTIYNQLFDQYIKSFATEGSRTILLLNNGDIFQFDPSKTPNWQKTRSINDINNKNVFSSSDRLSSYLVEFQEINNGGTYEYNYVFYDLINSNIINTITVEGNLYPFFYDFRGMSFWIGNNYKLKGNDIAYSNTLYTFWDYAIIDANNVFAIGKHNSNYNIQLLKGVYNGTMYVFQYYNISFNVNYGIACLESANNDMLVIGLGNTNTDNDGLYTYTISTNELKKIYNGKVYDISAFIR